MIIRSPWLPTAAAGLAHLESGATDRDYAPKTSRRASIRSLIDPMPSSIETASNPSSRATDLSWSARWYLEVGSQGGDNR